MSDIPPIHTSPSLAGIPPARVVKAPPSPQNPTPVDRVEISEAAELLSTLELDEEIRVDKVMAIRDAIANGTYETEEKLEVAVDRLLDVLRKAPESGGTAPP